MHNEWKICQCDNIYQHTSDGQAQERGNNSSKQNQAGADGNRNKLKAKCAKKQFQ